MANTLFGQEQLKSLMDEATANSWGTAHSGPTSGAALGAGLPPYTPSFGMPHLPTHTSSPSSHDRFNHNTMAGMICSRMGWLMTPGAISSVPFREMRCAKLNDQDAVVFIIHNNEPLVIRDDINLFPSDALVTSLRLLLS